MNKYKDKLPSETILYAKDIINKLGIILTEQWKDSGVKDCYSVRIEVMNTGIGTNGKGTNREYALASAYAEFLERIQNGTLFNFDKCKSLIESEGFLFVPDEINENIYDIDVKNNDLIKGILKSNEMVSNFHEEREFKTAFLNLANKFFVRDNEITSIPFYNLTSNKRCNLPAFLRAGYGTNGLCAGNTNEEALVQGISEILERYIHIRVLKENLKLPTIPMEFIKENYPNVYAMVENIVLSDRFDIIFKDCSLRERYPVCASIVIDKLSQSYVAHFGSHPDMDIALERTVTETFQGRHIEELTNSYVFGKRPYSITDNIIGHLTIGMGYYPDEFFCESESKFDVEIYKKKWNNNKEMLRFYIDLLKSKGMDVYVRNNTYLGFPAFQVIIPTMSEVFPIDDITLTKMNTLKVCRRALKNLDNINDETFEMILEFINYSVKLPHTFKGLKYFYGMPLNSAFEGDGLAEYYFLIKGYISINKYERALEVINVLIRLLGNTHKDYVYLKGLRDVLLSNNSGVEKDIFSIIQKFYPKDRSDKIINFINNKVKIFNDDYNKNCDWNCMKCKIQNECNYPLLSKIILKCKKIHKDNLTNQDVCEGIINE